MKIIDAHLHFSRIESFKRTAAEISHVDYSSEGLRREYEECGITAGIASLPFNLLFILPSSFLAKLHPPIVITITAVSRTAKTFFIISPQILHKNAYCDKIYVHYIINKA
jgi:hypothetical protein